MPEDASKAKRLNKETISNVGYIKNVSIVINILKSAFFRHHKILSIHSISPSYGKQGKDPSYKADLQSLLRHSQGHLSNREIDFGYLHHSVLYSRTICSIRPKLGYVDNLACCSLQVFHLVLHNLCRLLLRLSIHGCKIEFQSHNFYCTVLRRPNHPILIKYLF